MAVRKSKSLCALLFSAGISLSPLFNTPLALAQERWQPTSPCQTSSDAIIPPDAEQFRRSVLAAQKPDSPALARLETILVDWPLAPAVARIGQTKASRSLNRATEVAAVVSGELTIPGRRMIEDFADEPVVGSLSSISAADGKPNQGGAPDKFDVVNVTWSVDSAAGQTKRNEVSAQTKSSDSLREEWQSPGIASLENSPEPVGRSSHSVQTTSLSTVAEFEALAVPPNGVMSSLETTDSIVEESATLDESGRAKPHPQDMADLESLRPDLESDASGSAGRTLNIPVESTYLADLRSLLEQPAPVPFLFVNDAVLDLAPHEAEPETPAYLHDLKSLLSGQPVSAGRSRHDDGSVMTFVPARESSRRGATVAQKATEVYSIAPDPVCTPSTAKGLAFKPLNAIQLNGPSTEPPVISKREGSEASKTLKRPENGACEYMEVAVPACYFTPAGRGYCRPNRQPHVFCHNPLYFEDPNQERCGQSSGCLTTFNSAVHFATMIALTPYLTTATPPCSCVQALPDCPTCGEFGCQAYFPAWSWKGAVVQAAAVTGLVFIVP